MYHPGRSGFKGNNYQTLAALALFLQYLKDPTFLHIKMEWPGSVDFTYVFTGDHKILCEAKDREGGLHDSDLKKCAANLEANLKETVDASDEILFICNEFKSDTFKLIQRLKFWLLEDPQKELIKKGFKPELLKTLSKFRLWEQPKNALEAITYSLFSQAIPFWLPEEDIEEVVHSILLKNFHWGSAEGNVYTRENIELEIQKQAVKAKKKSTIFNEKYTNYGKQIDKIYSAVKKGDLEVGHSEITALSQDPSLMYLLLDKLKAEDNLKLDNWKSVWNACKIRYPLQLFDVFGSNIATKENREFVLSFVETSLDQLNTFYFDTYFEPGLAKLLTAIVQKDNSLDQAILSILRKQFAKYDQELFYLSSNQDKLHRKSDLCITLQSLYRNSTKKDAKERICNFIVDTFNLIEDDGDFSYCTPREIFQILKQYLNDDDNEYFEQRFVELTSKLAAQHVRFYRYEFGYDFEGLDAVGNPIMFYGHDYQVLEKHFVRVTLIPALRDLNRETRWKLIKEHCVVEREHVTKHKPDFLNRVAIPFVLEEYAEGNSEALLILRRYLSSSKVSSNIKESIYQFLKTSKLTDDQKWELSEITFDSEPLSPLVEQIVADLAFKGRQEAIAQIELWADNPGYLHRTLISDSNLFPNMEKLLCHAPHRATTMLKKLVHNVSFINALRQNQINEFYRLFARVITKSPSAWSIWDELKDKETLSVNEQQIVSGTLHDLCFFNGQKMLAKAFSAANAITSDYNKFVTKFSFFHSRQLFIQFFAEYAANEKEDPIPSFDIIKRFVNDPDPSNENDSNDPNGQFNYHKQILENKYPPGMRGVRAYAAFALVRAIRPGIESRMDEMISVVRSLTNDNNFHVRQLSCFALNRLAETRNSTTDGIRFISKPQAKEIEEIAFDMLEDDENKRPALQVAMADVFSRLKSIDFDHAMTAVSYFVKADSEALKKFLSAVIYFAELRHDFNIKQALKFQRVIFQLIKRDSGIKSTIAWYMSRLSNELNTEGKRYVYKTLKYVHELVEKYDQDAFEYIYSLIEDNMRNPKYTRELLFVYKKCIAREYEYLITHPNYARRMSAPYYRNGEMLEIIFAESKEEFLNVLEMLSKYPLVCNVGDLKHSIDLLFQIPPSYRLRVEAILDDLIRRYPILHEKRKLWEKRGTVVKTGSDSAHHS
jgi:hypothetical protein